MIRVKVEVTPGGETREFTFNESRVTVKKLLQAVSSEFKLPPNALVATRNGEVLLDNEPVRDGELIKLYKVVSGG